MARKPYEEVDDDAEEPRPSRKQAKPQEPFELEEREDEPQHTRGQNRRVFLISVGAAGLFVGLLTGLVGGYFLGRSSATRQEDTTRQEVPSPTKSEPAVKPTESPKPAVSQKQKSYPLDALAFEAAALGCTRDQLQAKFGSPDRFLSAGGWDGPVSVYDGPFTGERGNTWKRVTLWFKRQSGSSVVDHVRFEDGDFGSDK